jgi:hypothetical protein
MTTDGEACRPVNRPDGVRRITDDDGRRTLGVHENWSDQLSEEELLAISAGLAELVRRLEQLQQRLSAVSAAIQSSRRTRRSTRASRSSKRPRSS